MSKWIRKNDKVVVIKGNDKGKVGTVLAKREGRVIVQGVNQRKRHMKKSQKVQTSQIVTIEMPIQLSNVAFASEDGKPIYPKVRIREGKKELVALYKDKEIVLRTLNKG